jgi:hypothetical protein
VGENATERLIAVPAVESHRIRSVPWQPPDFDLLLAALAFVALLVDPVVAGRAHDVTPLAGALALLASAPLVARRRTPLGVLLMVAPLLLACLIVFHPDKAAVAVVMLVVFSVGERGDRGRSFVVGVLMAPVVMTAVEPSTEPAEVQFGQCDEPLGQWRVRHSSGLPGRVPPMGLEGMFRR